MTKNPIISLVRKAMKRCVECGQQFGNFYPEDGLCSTCKYNESIPENPIICKTCGHRADRHGTHYDSSTSCRGDDGFLEDNGCGCDQLRLKEKY